MPFSGDELFIYAPIMSEPPMATLKEMQDGTYSIDDVLDMNLMLIMKAKQAKDSQKKQESNNSEWV